MITIFVNASVRYEVKVGSGILKDISREIAAVNQGGSLCIVSDSNVWPLYGAAVKDTLEKAGRRCAEFVFPAGEQSKNGQTYLALLEFLAENHITRSDCILALGGGVVGDLAGFTAATYLRGIDYIQLPTTLLAAVDSSVGGKTAIDLQAGKNLAGAFYQPRLVLCDTDTLHTLPEAVFRDGCAEVIKYGILFDEALFDYLMEHGFAFDRESVIARCVELKRNVVAEDEFDRGQRQLLNLGHTIGHSIEAMSDFSVTHGSAVAMGMAIAARAGAAQGYCSLHCARKTEQILTRFGLNITTGYSAKDLARCALSDKKRSGGKVNLIIPRDIGSCGIIPTPVENLESFLEAGL